MLTRSGSLCVVAPFGFGGFSRGDYRWFAPLTGGCAVGLLGERFGSASARLRSLSLPGWSEGQLVQPGRTAVEVRARDLITQRNSTTLSYHLVPGSQAGRRYNPDRPHQSARHQREHGRLQRAVDVALAHGDVYAGGDSNFDGFVLDGLISAWSGRPHVPGRIDDVFATRAPSSVIEVETESDHRAVVGTTARTDSS